MESNCPALKGGAILTSFSKLKMCTLSNTSNLSNPSNPLNSGG
jgi:hypothetical protein